MLLKLIYFIEAVILLVIVIETLGEVGFFFSQWSLVSFHCFHEFNDFKI